MSVPLLTLVCSGVLIKLSATEAKVWVFVYTYEMRKAFCPSRRKHFILSSFQENCPSFCLFQENYIVQKGASKRPRPCLPGRWTRSFYSTAAFIFKPHCNSVWMSASAECGGSHLESLHLEKRQTGRSRFLSEHGLCSQTLLLKSNKTSGYL